VVKEVFTGFIDVCVRQGSAASSIRSPEVCIKCITLEFALARCTRHVSGLAQGVYNI
jgi:hypothetical protein